MDKKDGILSNSYRDGTTGYRKITKISICDIVHR